jgi:hypothetical protein
LIRWLVLDVGDGLVGGFVIAWLGMQLIDVDI